jgi:hypothetical protein
VPGGAASAPILPILQNQLTRQWLFVCLRLAGAFAKFRTAPLDRRHTLFRVGVAVQRRRTSNYLARRSASNCCVGSSMTLWYGVDDSPSARLVAPYAPDVVDLVRAARQFI